MKTSYVVRVKKTGEPIAETYTNILLILKPEMEIVPILQHLQEVNTPGTKAREWAERQA